MSARENPFCDPALVGSYEAWYESAAGRRADRLEKRLLSRMLGWLGDSVTLLDVGAGTGHFSRFFAGEGMEVVGVDISVPMVLEAERLGSPPFVVGDVLGLPFADCSFDLVAMVATLAFAAEPEQALVEAARVGRRGLLIGALNRSSRLGRRLRRATDEPWRSARLLSVPQLRRCVAAACQGRRHSVAWETTLWPGVSGACRVPWGDFIGMAVRWEDPW
jgi:ubiquinone/menaquinone biosynthesis C-methylase UbiE